MASLNSSSPFPPPTDPFQQVITMLLPDGTPFNVSVDDLSEFHFYGVQQAEIQGVEVGMSVVMLMAVVVLTQSGKRRSTVFVLNILALLFNTIRAIMLGVYTCGPFQNVYSYFGNDYSNVPRSAYAASVAVPVVKMLQLIVVEASLTLQTHVVLVTTRRAHRLAIMALAVIIALTAVAFQFAVMVTNAEAIMTLGLGPPIWIPNAANIAATISVCFFSFVFTFKLGYALRQRHKLGLRRFGPMQILFIMGLGTMIIPAIFSFIVYFEPISELATMFLCLVTILLPLSALWAAAAIETPFESIKLTPNRPLFDSGSGGKNTFNSRSKTYASSGSAFLDAKTYGTDSSLASPPLSKKMLLPQITENRSLDPAEATREELVARERKGEQGIELKDLLTETDDAEQGRQQQQNIHIYVGRSFDVASARQQ